MSAFTLEVLELTDAELEARIAEYWCHAMATEDEEMFRSLKQDHGLLVIALEQRRKKAAAS